MKAQGDTWNAALYDEKHQFVSNYGASVLQLLQAQAGEHILDVGCGTGDIANTLQQNGVHVVGIDNSPNMIAQAQAKYPNITFQCENATNLPFEEQFDAVFSNAALHWMKNATSVVQSIHRALKPGGRFVAEFGGAGNVQSITDALIGQIKQAGFPFEQKDFPWYFPTIGQYCSLLEEHQFTVRLAQHFDRPTLLNGENGLDMWLEMFSPALFEKMDMNSKRAIFEKTVNELRPVLYKDGHWYADYKRLRIVAIKND